MGSYKKKKTKQNNITNLKTRFLLLQWIEIIIQRTYIHYENQIRCIGLMNTREMEGGEGGATRSGNDGAW